MTPAFLCVAWTLDAFDPRGGDAARKSYASFIDEGLPRPELVAEIEGSPPALGGAEFLREWQPVAARAACDSTPKAQRFLARPDLPALFAGCTHREERNRLIRLAHERYGFTQHEIAMHLGLHPSTVSLLVRDARANDPGRQAPADTPRTQRFET